MWQPEKVVEMDVDGGAVEEYNEGRDLRKKLDEITAALGETGDQAPAILGYREVLDYVCTDPAGPSESVGKVKEEAIYGLAKAYANSKRFSDVVDLLKTASPFFATIPKARTAKIVRTIIDIVSKVPDSLELQDALCRQVVAWCRAEKRNFLRQRIQSRQASLLFEQGKYQNAVTLLNKLLRELKRMDDKQLLVETHLVEARVHNALRNTPKAKAALTAARTAGNSIYIAPIMQAELDDMSGTLHCEEGDYKTSFSYFLESYEAFDSQEDSRALRSLKYMLLCKVLQGSASEVGAILAGKWGVKHTGAELDAMAEVAKSAKNRSLEEFDAAVSVYGKTLEKDLLIKHHLGILYDQLLESNLLKIIQPFSCVELDHVAELIKLPVDRVELKLSQMILDKKLLGILDQGKGQLIIYEEAVGDKRNNKNTVSPCDPENGNGYLCMGLGFLPSKEAVASKGLEAKVDMATHGHDSWALTNLGAWRNKSLSTSSEGKSAEFVKSRQREARRAMLGAAPEGGAARKDKDAPDEQSVGAGVGCRPVPAVVPAKPPGEGGCSDMAVG